MEKIIKTQSQWQEILSPEEFNVCRQGGTQRPFVGKYNSYKGEGIFTCKCCNNELFDAKTKFDSGTGWLSFYEPISSDALIELKDTRTKAT